MPAKSAIMDFTTQINQDIKAAMLAKEKDKLAALRSIKSALLLEATKDGSNEVSEAAALKILQKLLKQHNESATVYKEQGRDDLFQEEQLQADVIAAYLPQPLSEEEVEAKVKQIIEESGASCMADMGKVMGAASQQLAGKADNKVVSALVRKLLA